MLGQLVGGLLYHRRLHAWVQIRGVQSLQKVLLLKSGCCRGSEVGMNGHWALSRTIVKSGACGNKPVAVVHRIADGRKSIIEY
jgi:hypothetical protein